MFVLKRKCQNADSFLNDSKLFAKKTTLFICIFLIRALITLNPVWHSVDRASWCILTMKANEMHYFSDLFDKVLYMFRTSLLSIIRSNSTQYTQQQVFVMLVLLASASVVRMDVYSVEIILMMDSGLVRNM
jgi:hypothetical protein